MPSNHASVSESNHATDADTEHWSSSRKFIAAVVTHKAVEVVLSILVLTSIALAVIDADKKAVGDEVPSWVAPVEMVLLVLYALEMSLRVYVLRSQIFNAPLNCLELAIVLIDSTLAIITVAGVEVPQVSFLRILRLIKLARAFKILEAQPQLKFFVEAFYFSVKTMMFGWFFIAVAIVVFAILAVEFLNPLKPEFSPTCTRCPQAFMSVFEAMAALFQTVVMGDEWAEVFRPYLAEYPGTVCLIVPMFVVLNLGFMNLIMAGIVETANQAREASFKKKAQAREQEFIALEHKFHDICRSMDDDGSGSITLKELLKGFETNEAFRTTLNAMDLKKQDLVAVFEILDKDGSGDVEYEEFVSELHKMRSSDSHTMLVFIKHYVTDLQKTVNSELCTTQRQVAGGILKLQEILDARMKRIDDHIDSLQDDRGMLVEQQKLTRDDLAIPQQYQKGSTPAPISNVPSPMPPARPFLTAAGMPPLAAANVESADAVTCGQNLAAHSQLLLASEQIGAHLEDLRRKCEQSAVLLTTFCGLLPRSTKSTELSLRNAANTVNASPSGYQEKKQESEGFWTPQSCCIAPSLAAQPPGLRSSRLGLPLPENAALHTGVIGQPPDREKETAGSNSRSFGAFTESGAFAESANKVSGA
mmetsp:Transcript_159649/g.291326  ORF Transcript_159649/g.291326 Transcript_159649/m.291326 type:complete len:645 (+) Transcript_159649:68-2002(+)